jgi:hypothetical protein
MGLLMKVDNYIIILIWYLAIINCSSTSKITCFCNIHTYLIVINPNFVATLCKNVSSAVHRHPVGLLIKAGNGPRTTRCVFQNSNNNNYSQNQKARIFFHDF